MKKWLALLMLMAMACMLNFAGCGDDETTDGDVDGDQEAAADGDDDAAVDGDDEAAVDGDDEAAADGDDDAAVDGDDEAVDGDDGPNPPLTGQTGAACADKDECDDPYCVTKEALVSLGLTVEDEITGGYCSALMCQVDGSGETCQADYDFCFSLFPFQGELMKAVGLCARNCSTDADCRADDDQSCWDLSEMVTSGLDQAVYEELYQDQHVCLPDSLIDTIKAALSATE